MGVLGNVLKVIASIIIGYIVGWMIGAFLGAIFGVFISFLLPEVTSPHQAILVSLFISITLGCLLSLSALQVFNRLSETNINSFLGAIPGTLIGFIIVVFVYGYVEVAEPNKSYVYRTMNHLLLSPIMPYSANIGGQIGAVTFALFGAVGVIWDIIQSYLQPQRNRELMKNSPPSKWGFPEIPQDTLSIQTSRTKRSSLSLGDHITSTRGRIFFSLLRAFVSACAIGIVLSIVGWQILGWNSSTQFSTSLFWVGALLAMYGYFDTLPQHQFPTGDRYSATAGDMNLHERTKQWTTGAKTSFTSLPTIFLVSAFLFGFSILVSIIF